MTQASQAWRSTRLIFKGVETSDDGFLFDLRSDSEAYLNRASFLATPPTQKDATNHREFLEKCLLAVIICIPSPTPPRDLPSTSAAAAPPLLNSAPFTRTSPETLIPIGDMHLRTDAGNAFLSHHRSAEIGVSIHKDYQGQGYGSEAIRWILEWAFQRANLHRVGIGAFSWNEGAVRVYQKLGFVVEGRKREVYWHDGAYRDLIEMSMLQHEWAALQAKKAQALVTAS